MVVAEFFVHMSIILCCRILAQCVFPSLLLPPSQLNFEYLIWVRELSPRRVLGCTFLGA